MKEYEKLLEITSDSKVTLAQDFKTLLHTKLLLGQSRYVCRNGTLSEGHDCLVPAQRYFSAIRQAFHLAMNITLQRAVGMESHAALLDAKEELEIAAKESDKLRATAKILKNEQSLAMALITVEDQLRQLDEFLSVERELRDEVDKSYPQGIEQAEEDNWRAVAEYRARNRALGIPEMMKNIPLPSEIKAEIGAQTGNLDMLTWDMLKEGVLGDPTLEKKYLYKNYPHLMLKEEANGQNILGPIRKR